MRNIVSAALLLATLTLITVILVGVASGAASGAVCLSKKEARQLWPRQHIYWYSKHRCWSNRRGPPRNLRMDPIINSNAMAKDKPEAINTKTKDSDYCCWPSLDRDTLGNIIEPLRSFIDRWQDQPWIGRIIGK